MANRKLARKIRNTMEVVEDYLPMIELALSTLALKDSKRTKYYSAALMATAIAKRAGEKATLAASNDEALTLSQVDNAANLGKHIDGLLEALMHY